MRRRTSFIGAIGAFVIASPAYAQSLTIGFGVTSYNPTRLVVDAPFFQAENHPGFGIGGAASLRLVGRVRIEATAFSVASDFTVMPIPSQPTVVYDRLTGGAVRLRVDVLRISAAVRVYLAAGPGFLHRPTMGQFGGDHDLWAVTADLGLAAAASRHFGLRVAASAWTYQGHKFGASNGTQTWSEQRQLDITIAALLEYRL